MAYQITRLQIVFYLELNCGKLLQRQRKLPFYPCIMKFLIFPIFLYLSCGYSQISIIDNQTKEKIGFVDIYDQNDVFIGSTNDKLFIDNELKNRILKQSNFVTIKAAFYEQRKLVISDFINLNEFFLEKKVYQLDEVIVQNDRNKKFLKITGYFRSTQLNNDVVQYFNDGIVEYYIDLKTNKITPRSLTNRAFQNKNIKQITSNINFSVVGIPNINKLDKDKNVSSKISKENQLIKKVYIHNDSTSVKEMSFFGNKSILKDYSTTLIYNDTLTNNNLLYFKENRKYNIKSKKDTNYTNIDAIHEFYVTNVEYVNIAEKQNCRFYVFERNKKYDYQFWKKINNIVYDIESNSSQKLEIIFNEIDE